MAGRRLAIAPGTLRVDGLRPATGRGVRIVVVDSGVHATHPHVGGVAGGVGVSAAGALEDDYVDRLGHGTAVTAAIREKAPGAELLVARVFDRRLDTSVEALAAAVRWGIAEGAHLDGLCDSCEPGQSLSACCAGYDAEFDFGLADLSRR